MIELLEQPGVRRIEGGLGQKALAHLMRASLVWAHPSWWSTGDQEFHETSCISAMEAQAAGCVVVASNWGALTETVQHGTLIDGDPRDPAGSWRRQFVDSICRGLTDEPTRQAAQVVGPELMRDMDWRGAAEQLAAMIPARTLGNL
jgi:glycosyltransferase involved in cell wall biosynthesis